MATLPRIGFLESMTDRERFLVSGVLAGQDDDLRRTAALWGVRQSRQELPQIRATLGEAFRDFDELPFPDKLSLILVATRGAMKVKRGMTGGVMR